VAVDDIAEKVYLARQPILDANRKPFAYELLFRSGANAGGAVIQDATQATARVLVNALNSVGIESLVGKSLAFVNCDRQMLLDRNFEPLDPKVFVLEILEDVAGDPEIVKVVEELKQFGFPIALDDFVVNPDHIQRTKHLLPLANFIKVDLMQNTKEQVRSCAALCRALPGMQLLAEKVETEEQFQECKSWGYTLFQGYFFAKPEIVSGRKLDPRTTGVMQLLQVLRSDPDISILENEFKRQPEITMNMLKFINSASVGMRNHIESIRQALALIGQRKLQQWLMLLMFAGSSANAADALYENAAQRARFMENLARVKDPKGDLHERAFLAGMLSRMDALCKVNIETILSEFELGEDLSAALLQQKGVLGDLLKITAALELDQLAITMGLCQLHNIDNEKLQSCLMESWAWVATVKG